MINNNYKSIDHLGWFKSAMTMNQIWCILLPGVFLILSLISHKIEPHGSMGMLLDLWSLWWWPVVVNNPVMSPKYVWSKFVVGEVSKGEGIFMKHCRPPGFMPDVTDGCASEASRVRMQDWSLVLERSRCSKEHQLSVWCLLSTSFGRSVPVGWLKLKQLPLNQLKLQIGS